MPQAAAELPRSPRSGGRGARGPEASRPPGEWPTGGGVAWLATGNTEAPQAPPPVPRLQQVARMTKHGLSSEEAQPLFTRRKGVRHQEGGGLGLTNPAARTDDTWEVPPPSRRPRAALAIVATLGRTPPSAAPAPFRPTRPDPLRGPIPRHSAPTPTRARPRRICAPVSAGRAQRAGQLRAAQAERERRAVWVGMG